MNKNVLIISSTFSGTRFSKKIAEEFKKGAEKNNNVELIDLKGKKIRYCLGCNTCQKNGGTCVYKDDMPEILEKMINADIIVLASPIYFYSITGQMKTFIDRCYSKFMNIENKDFYYILTCAAPYSEKYKKDLDIAIDSFRGFVKCLPNCIEKGIIIGDNTAAIENIEEHKILKEAYKMGEKIL